MILVTGGLGYLGGQICKELINCGEEVRIATSRANAKIPHALSKCQIVNIDLLNTDSLIAACEGIDAIIHLSALNAHESNLDPKQALLINSFGTENILNAAIHCKVQRFLYFSTVHVYGHVNKTTITESTVTEPRNHYAITHKLAEDYVLKAGNDISVSIFRLSNVIGSPISKDVNCWMLIAHDLCKQVIISGSMKINANKNITRDFICLSDLSCITYNYISNIEKFKKIHNEILNISSGEPVSLENFAKKIAVESEKIFHFKPKIKYKNLPEKKIEPIVISNKKAIKLGLVINLQLNKEIHFLLRNCKIWFGT